MSDLREQQCMSAAIYEHTPQFLKQCRLRQCVERDTSCTYAEPCGWKDWEPYNAATQMRNAHFADDESPYEYSL